MTYNEWNRLKHFSMHENWGDPDRMDRDLVHALERFREYLGCPIIVVCGTQGEHIENSQHDIGRAVDIVVPQYKRTLFDLFLDSLRFQFNGIGIYPDWVYDRKRIGGLHLDTRDLTIATPRVHKAFWLGKKEDSKTVYYPLSSVTMKKYLEVFQ